MADKKGIAKEIKKPGALNKEEFLSYLDKIEQRVRDIEITENSMRLQLIALADSIMTYIDYVELEMKVDA
jgi:hypothetical protein